MPASVNVEKIGHSEQALKAELKDLFKDYSSEWTINLLGEALTTFLVLRVTDPEGRDVVMHRIYKEDGNTFEKIMNEVRLAVAGMRNP